MGGSIDRSESNMHVFGVGRRICKKESSEMCSWMVKVQGRCMYLG